MHLIGVDQEYFMKFKPAMVKSVTVDYGAGGTLAVMKGGRPAGVNIQITLQELQIETANDYGAVSLQPMNAQEPEELALNYTEPDQNYGVA
jgi:c-di-GMP-binding flagellar brake protein YcgR